MRWRSPPARNPPDTLGVEALDAHTLRVQLSGPTPYLLDLLAQQYIYPVYEPAISTMATTGCDRSTWCATGHSCCARTCIGSRITLEKNDKYWDAAHVRLQRVVYYILPDQSAQASRFLAGEVRLDGFLRRQPARLAQVE